LSVLQYHKTCSVDLVEARNTPHQLYQPERGGRPVCQLLFKHTHFTIHSIPGYIGHTTPKPLPAGIDHLLPDMTLSNNIPHSLDFELYVPLSKNARFLGDDDLVPFVVLKHHNVARNRVPVIHVCKDGLINRVHPVGSVLAVLTAKTSAI
jgi:hypothetical protein